jgi:hypothetical protein
MAYLEFIKLALFAITRNKTRAFLTMLGIIFSVSPSAIREASTPFALAFGS